MSISERIPQITFFANVTKDKYVHELNRGVDGKYFVQKILKTGASDKIDFLENEEGNITVRISRQQLYTLCDMLDTGIPFENIIWWADNKRSDTFYHLAPANAGVIEYKYGKEYDTLYNKLVSGEFHKTDNPTGKILRVSRSHLDKIYSAAQYIENNGVYTPDTMNDLAYKRQPAYKESTVSDEGEFVVEKPSDPIVGWRVSSAYTLSQADAEELASKMFIHLGYGQRIVVIELSNGNQLFALSDDEGNGFGSLAYMVNDDPTTVYNIGAVERPTRFGKRKRKETAGSMLDGMKAEIEDYEEWNM